MSFETSANIVGLTNHPFSKPSGLPVPPVTNFAPSSIPT